MTRQISLSPQQEIHPGVRDAEDLAFPHTESSLLSMSKNSREFLAARRIAEALAALPVESLAPQCTKITTYIVGGWCRDQKLGRASGDIDLEVFGVTRDALKGVLVQLFGRRVILPSKSPLAPFKVLLAGKTTLDVMLPVGRIGREGSELQRALQVAPHIPLETAILRRDFTCNALYFDILEDRFIDPTAGIIDIKNKRLTLIPSLGVADINPAMPLRACRLANECSLAIESRTKRMVSEAVELGVLSALPKEICLAEITKLLTRTETPSVALRYALELGVLSKLMPEVRALKNVPQDPCHHPEGSALEHSLRALDVAATLSQGMAPRERWKILLATLLHDVGKATHTQIEKNVDGSTKKIAHHGHERSSAELAVDVCNRLGVATDIRNQVVKMVTHHMRPLGLAANISSGQRPEVFDNEVRKLVRDVFPAKIESFLVVCAADRLGRGKVAVDIEIINRIRESVERNQFHRNPNNRLLDGTLLRGIGFKDKDGLIFRIIKYTEDRRDAGRVNSENQARYDALIKFALNSEDLTRHGIHSADQKAQLYKALKVAVRSEACTTVEECLTFLSRFKEQRS